jgi:hypothetical protein
VDQVAAAHHGFMAPACNCTTGRWPE